LRRIGERVGFAAGGADYHADQGGCSRAQEYEQEQPDTQRSEFGNEADGRRSN